jgi:ABC-type taurine transport system substrate-binding protein
MGPRYILARVKADPSVAKRYQRSGWLAFDTYHKQHGQVWLTRRAAADDVARLNGGE